MTEFRIETPRLNLRRWRTADVDAFHGICSDPQVMATLGPLLSRPEVAALITRMQRMQDASGHCFWAMERKEDHGLIGWCGVIRGAAGTPVEGKIEAGWRMAVSAWGKGYATEAANAALIWAFSHLPDDAVWAITSTGNARSRAVMERLGMEYQPQCDFDHPGVAADSLLRRHVTYRMQRSSWNRGRKPE